MNNVRKMGLVASALIAICFVTTTFATELASQENICEQYVKSDAPIPINVSKETAAALNACIENNSCTDALSNLPNCTKKLLMWQMNYEQAQTQRENAQQATQQPAATTKSSVSTTQAPIPATPETKTEAVTETPNTTEFYQPTKKSEDQNQTESQPEKEQTKENTPKQPSINWF